MKLNRKIKLVLTVAALVFVGGSILGTLLIPAILAVSCSYYWLFLYGIYFLAILYLALYFARYWDDNTGTRK
jgi:phosphotransferase system  glucose/maltose/N-acetylglucosamine-specific IIC component